MEAIPDRTRSSGLVIHGDLLLVVQILESMEQHCANIDSDPSKCNKCSVRDDDHLSIQLQLIKLKEQFERQSRRPNEASDINSQQSEDFEVQQPTPPDPTASPSTGQKDEEAGPQDGSLHETVSSMEDTERAKPADMMLVLSSLRHSSAALGDAVTSLSDKIGHQEKMTDTSEELLFLKDRHKVHDRAIHNLESCLVKHLLGSQADFWERLKALQDDLVDLKRRLFEQGDIGHLQADISALKKQMENVNKLMISCFLTANAGRQTSQEKHLTKPYQVAVVCKEARCMADEVTHLREEVRVYKVNGIPQTGMKEPLVRFNDSLATLQTARAELLDRLSSLGLDIREASAVSQLYITPLLKALAGLGEEVTSLGNHSTTPIEDHTQFEEI